MKYFNISQRLIGLWLKIINWGLCLFIFLLPWQTRLIYHEAILNKEVWEYGRLSLYGTEILLVILIILGIVRKCLRYPEPQVEAGFKPAFGVKDPITYAIIAVIMFTGLSIIWSADKAIAAQAWLRILEGIGLFWLVYDTRQFMSNFKLAFIGSGAVQGLLAIYQFFTQSTFASKWLGLPYIETNYLGASVIEFLDERWLRAYGSFPHPNILGGFLAIVLLLIVIGLWQLNVKIKNQNEILKADIYLNTFYWFSAGIVFLGLLFSFSRSAGLGFVLGFIYLFIYTLKNKLKIQRWLSIKLAIFFVALFGFILIGWPYQLFTVRITTQSKLEQKSLIERQTAITEAKAIFKTNPVIGIGLGNYTKQLQDKYPNYPGWAYQPVHNWHWLALSELGFIGFLLFVFLLVNLWRRTGTIEKSLILVLLFISFFDHYFWDLFFGLMLWWLVWGMVLDKENEFLTT